MKKDCYSLYDFSRRITDDDFQINVPLCEEFVDVDSKCSDDSLLKLIYAEDERTGLPIGDIQYYVSDKANPQVKQFILDNLLQDVSVAVNPAAKYNLSDDDILALSRNKGESVQEYADRLNSSIQRDMWMIEQASKKNVPSRPKESPVSSE